MNFIAAIFTQTIRNLFQTWSSQVLTLMTISLSVLIFSFFYLIYTNVLHIGSQFEDDLRLIVYLDEEPGKAMQDQYRDKILKFDKVEKIVFVSSREAFKRFSNQLKQDRDILQDMPEDFLPPSIEIYPIRSLDTLTKIKRFSNYLQTLPGILKVQYGKQWIDRFYTFIQLLRIVVILSGVLLILTTTFTVGHTIRLTLMNRRKELELLRLLGASDHYIRLPFFFEGALQGLTGSALGLTALYLLFNWVKLRFEISASFELFHHPTFFPLPTLIMIIAISTLLCGCGSFSSTSKFLRL